jgi:hypothetical protein
MLTILVLEFAFSYPAQGINAFIINRRQICKLGTGPRVTANGTAATNLKLKLKGRPVANLKEWLYPYRFSETLSGEGKSGSIIASDFVLRRS